MGYSIRTDRYRYTEWGGGEFGVELYDYQQDPQEFDNLAAYDEFSDVVAVLRHVLEDNLASFETAE